jgi:hypothetical protein
MMNRSRTFRPPGSQNWPVTLEARFSRDLCSISRSLFAQSGTSAVTHQEENVPKTVGISKRQARALLAAVALAAVAVALVPTDSRAAGWSQPKVVSPAQEKLEFPQAAVGPRGYSVITWSGPQQFIPVGSGVGLEPPPNRARITVAVKAPGKRDFGKLRKFGAPGARGANIGIARNGQTVLTWAELDGTLKAAFRTPRTNWTKPQTVSKQPSFGGTLSVGPDGTAILARVVHVNRTPASRRVFASVRKPGKRFGPMKWVNNDEGVVGNYLAVAAATKGRATLAWSGWCPIAPISDQEPARAVDFFGPRKATKSRPVPNSKCPTTNIELERDPRGSAYLMLGGSAKEVQTVRVAIRRPRSWFSKARDLNPKGTTALSGHLVLGRDGTATALWTDIAGGEQSWGRPTGVSYAKANRRKGFGKARKLPVHPREFLMDAASLPNGRVATLWENLENWQIKPGLLSPKSFRFGEPFATLREQNVLTEGGIETDSRGYRLAFWAESNPRTGTLTDLSWSQCSSCSP